MTCHGNRWICQNKNTFRTDQKSNQCFDLFTNVETRISMMYITVCTKTSGTVDEINLVCVLYHIKFLVAVPCCLVKVNVVCLLAKHM